MGPICESRTSLSPQCFALKCRRPWLRMISSLSAKPLVGAGDMVPVVARVEVLYNHPVSAIQASYCPRFTNKFGGVCQVERPVWSPRIILRVLFRSDHDSDIEELRSPPPVPSNRCGPPQRFDSLLGKASEVLKILIPPVRPALSNQSSPIMNHIFFSPSPQPPSEFVGSPGLRSPAINPLDHDDAIHLLRVLIFLIMTSTNLNSMPNQLPRWNLVVHHLCLRHSFRVL